MSQEQFDRIMGYIDSGKTEGAKMLTGDPAQGRYYDLENVIPALGGMLPASVSGANAPTAGAPEYFNSTLSLAAAYFAPFWMTSKKASPWAAWLISAKV